LTSTSWASITSLTQETLPERSARGLVGEEEDQSRRRAGQAGQERQLQDILCHLRALCGLRRPLVGPRLAADGWVIGDSVDRELVVTGVDPSAGVTGEGHLQDRVCAKVSRSPSPWAALSVRWFREGEE